MSPEEGKKEKKKKRGKKVGSTKQAFDFVPSHNYVYTFFDTCLACAVYMILVVCKCRSHEVFCTTFSPPIGLCVSGGPAELCRTVIQWSTAGTRWSTVVT